MNEFVADMVLKFSDFSRGDFLASFNSTFSSWEAAVAGFFIFAIFFYSLSIGRGRLLLFLISTYIAKLLADSFVYVDYLAGIFGGRIFSLYLALFIFSYVVVFAILDKSILRVRLSTKEFPVGKLFILSTIIVILLTNVVFTYLPSEIALNIKSGDVVKYLVGDTAFFWWFLLSLFSITLFRRKKKKDE